MARKQPAAGACPWIAATVPIREPYRSMHICCNEFQNLGSLSASGETSSDISFPAENILGLDEARMTLWILGLDSTSLIELHNSVFSSSDRELADGLFIVSIAMPASSSIVLSTRSLDVEDEDVEK